MRKQSLIYRYFKPKEKPRAAAIPRNAAPLNEGEIELFQLIRLNRHEKTQDGGAIAARPPSTPYSSRERHDSVPPFDLSSFGFTWTTPGGEISRKLYRGRSPPRSALVLLYAAYTRTSVYPTFWLLNFPRIVIKFDHAPRIARFSEPRNGNSDNYGRGRARTNPRQTSRKKKFYFAVIIAFPRGKADAFNDFNCLCEEEDAFPIGISPGASVYRICSSDWFVPINVINKMQFTARIYNDKLHSIQLRSRILVFYLYVIVKA